MDQHYLFKLYPNCILYSLYFVQFGGNILVFFVVLYFKGYWTCLFIWDLKPWLQSWCDCVAWMDEVWELFVLGHLCGTHFVFEECYLRTGEKTVRLQHSTIFADRLRRIQVTLLTLRTRNKKQATFGVLFFTFRWYMTKLDMFTVSCIESRCYAGAAITVYEKWSPDSSIISLVQMIIETLLHYITLHYLIMSELEKSDLQGQLGRIKYVKLKIFIFISHLQIILFICLSKL